jgi:lipoate-protein ligase A
VTSWGVERLAGSAADLHAIELPDPVERAVWILEATAAALVLGSTQATVEVSGLAVCRRKSGGGAVLVRPGEVLWIDVLIPRTDDLWDEDVGRAAHWLGRTWAQALGQGVVHTGGLVPTFWSSQICFAGVGPGEVLIDGRKVVGISQRRTRVGARFQCVVLRVWDPTELARIFAPGEWSEVADRLEPAAVGVSDLAALEAAFLAAIATR